MTTLMAQNRGAGKHDRVKQGFLCGMRIEGVYGVLIAVVCFGGAPFIMKLFVTDPEVVHLGVRFLRTVSLFYLMPTATNGIQGFFRGIGDLKVTAMRWAGSSCCSTSCPCWFGICAAMKTNYDRFI